MLAASLAVQETPQIVAMKQKIRKTGCVLKQTLKSFLAVVKHPSFQKSVKKAAVNNLRG